MWESSGKELDSKSDKFLCISCSSRVLFPATTESWSSRGRKLLASIRSGSKEDRLSPEASSQTWSPGAASGAISDSVSKLPGTRVDLSSGCGLVISRETWLREFAGAGCGVD